MVEGGGTVHTQFLTDDIVDELQLTVAPVFVGDSDATRFVRDGMFPWNPARRAELVDVQKLGDVVLLRYALSSRFEERRMLTRLPTATIRTQVELPLRFADGYDDRRAGVQLRRARRRPGAPRLRARRPASLLIPRTTAACRWSARTASASPATCSAASGATAGRSCARPSSGSPRPAATSSTCVRKGRGIGLYSKLEAYALQDAGIDTYDANLALGHDEDERSYVAAAQMLDALGVSRVAAPQQQPRQGAAAALLRRDRCRAGADGRAPLRREPPLPGDEGAPRPAHPRASGRRIRRGRSAVGTRDDQIREPHHNRRQRPRGLGVSLRRRTLARVGADGRARAGSQEVPRCRPARAWSSGRSCRSG